MGMTSSGEMQMGDMSCCQEMPTSVADVLCKGMTVNRAGQDESEYPFSDTEPTCYEGVSDQSETCQSSDVSPDIVIGSQGSQLSTAVGPAIAVVKSSFSAHYGLRAPVARHGSLSFRAKLPTTPSFQILFSSFLI